MGQPDGEVAPICQGASFSASLPWLHPTPVPSSPLPTHGAVAGGLLGRDVA